MLNSVEFPSNVHIKYKDYYADANEPSTIMHHYIKDNKDYIIQEDTEHKENVNGKKCIKVSFTDDVSKYYFYIDLETNFIVKHEAYHGDSKENLEMTVAGIYEYYPNTVTDEQILKFDKNNYTRNT